MAQPHDPTSTPNLPQADTTSGAWDPSTISNIIFSAIMVFIGIIAIWQAHLVHRRSSRAHDEEELVAMQPPSRASTMMSNGSYDAGSDQLMLPQGQLASTAGDQEGVGGLTLPRRAGGLDAAHTPSGSAVAT